MAIRLCFELVLCPTDQLLERIRHYDVPPWAQTRSKRLEIGQKTEGPSVLQKQLSCLRGVCGIADRGQVLCRTELGIIRTQQRGIYSVSFGKIVKFQQLVKRRRYQVYYSDSYDV